MWVSTCKCAWFFSSMHHLKLLLYLLFLAQPMINAETFKFINSLGQSWGLVVEILSDVAFCFRLFLLSSSSNMQIEMKNCCFWNIARLFSFHTTTTKPFLIIKQSSSDFECMQISRSDDSSHTATQSTSSACDKHSSKNIDANFPRRIGKS